MSLCLVNRTTVDPFVTNLDFHLGIGLDLSFWSSRWFGEFPLNEVFPCLYALSSLPKLSVAETGFGGKLGWKWHLQFLVLTASSEHIQKKLELYLALHNQSPIIHKHDAFLWSASDSNQYTVSSGYDLLLQVDVEGVISEVLSKALAVMWRAKLPSEIQIFIWRLVLDCLATKEIKRARNDAIFRGKGFSVEDPISSIKWLYCLNVEEVSEMITCCHYLKLTYAKCPDEDDKEACLDAEKLSDCCFKR
ncbi:hypothetical protein KIW84_031300 [Lathyrus oleraceus]|uniref:Reverse transcriptase zinc-binding domain-containing protein n=1 Tax=Pisum sativum TaxID=3888 RepID=A0A9D4XUY7_PEA|nr:hypothetical protein KIW84_031300 [Pisum sativum]